MVNTDCRQKATVATETHGWNGHRNPDRKLQWLKQRQMTEKLSYRWCSEAECNLKGELRMKPGLEAVRPVVNSGIRVIKLVSSGKPSNISMFCPLSSKMKRGLHLDLPGYLPMIITKEEGESVL